MLFSPSISCDETMARTGKRMLKQVVGVVWLSLVQSPGMTNKIRKSGMAGAIPAVISKSVDKGQRRLGVGFFLN